jgi:transaldolase
MAIAASIGAHYVAPYFGRISDLGRDAVAEIATMQAISMQGVGKTQILAASLRTLNDVEHLCALGVHAFTLSPALAEAMISDPNSAEATRVFEETVEASLI